MSIGVRDCQASGADRELDLAFSFKQVPRQEGNLLSIASDAVGLARINFPLDLHEL